MSDAPRRAAGEGSIFRRVRNGREEFVARLPLNEWIVTEGKRRRRYWHGVYRDKRSAERGLDAALDDRNKGRLHSSMLLGPLIDKWFAHGRDVLDWSPATLDTYHFTMRHWRPRIERLRLDRLTKADLQSGLDAFMIRKPAPSTVRLHVNVLRSLFSYAVDRELRDDNPAARLTVPKQRDTEKRPFNGAQVATFWDACAGHRFGTFYRSTLVLGLRSSEVRALRWADIDFADSTVAIVQRQYRVHTTPEWDGYMHTGRPKSDESNRVVSFPPEFADELHALHAAQDDQREAAGEFWEGTELVFSDDLGRPLHEWTLNRDLKRLCRDNALPEKTMHDLRRSHGTYLLLQGLSLDVVKKRLGHADRKTTELYAKVLPELEREAAQAMGTLVQASQQRQAENAAAVDEVMRMFKEAQ
jgi:integrase